MFDNFETTLFKGERHGAKTETPTETPAPPVVDEAQNTPPAPDAPPPPKPDNLPPPPKAKEWGGGAESAKEPQPQAQPTAKTFKLSNDMADFAAGLYVDTLDYLVPMICLAISGGDSAAKYQMPAVQKKMYTRVTKDFFLYNDFIISPTVIFAGMTVIVLALPTFAAFVDKKKNKNQKAAAEQSKAAAAQIVEAVKEGAAAAEEEAKAAHFLVTPSEKIRGNFKIDVGGTYQYAEKGEYLKKEERTEKASPAIIEMWENRMKNAEIFEAVQKNGVTA